MQIVQIVQIPDQGCAAMSGRVRLLIPLLMILVVAAVGIVEAWRTGEVGLLGLLIAVEVLASSIVVTLRVSSPVMVRGDLAAWLETTSAITGETTSALANRALSAYRANLSDDERA